MSNSWNTWADAYGVWHVRVSANPALALIVARRALRDEIAAREDITKVRREVYMSPVWVPELSTEGSMVFREGGGVA